MIMEFDFATVVDSLFELAKMFPKFDQIPEQCKLCDFVVLPTLECIPSVCIVSHCLIIVIFCIVVAWPTNFILIRKYRSDGH